jgi:hypothetical protein
MLMALLIISTLHSPLQKLVPEPPWCLWYATQPLHVSCPCSSDISDYINVIICGSRASPHPHFACYIVGMFPFIFANQIQDLGEDCKNKPSSPMLCLPFTFLSIAQLISAGWWSQSAWCYRRVRRSSSTDQHRFALWTIWYNDFPSDKMGWSKNVLTAILGGCLENGGTVAPFWLKRHPEDSHAFWCCLCNLWRFREDRICHM